MSLLKNYFKKELDESSTDYAEIVLATLSAAIRSIPSEEKLRAVLDVSARPVSIEERERFEKFLEREGMEGWWD